MKVEPLKYSHAENTRATTGAAGDRGSAGAHGRLELHRAPPHARPVPTSTDQQITCAKHVPVEYSKAQHR